jgi:hypothetical protein
MRKQHRIGWITDDYGNFGNVLADLAAKAEWKKIRSTIHDVGLVFL